MEWFCQLIFLLIVIVICTKQQQRIVEGPSDTVVKLGQTALLKCQVESQVGAVQWVKDGFGLNTDRLIDGIYPRYKIEGSVSKGEYNLRINNISIDDDDIFECQMQAAVNNPTRISNKAKLTVLVEPQLPTMFLEDDVLNVIAGQYIQRSCVSKDGKPPSVIGWAITENNSTSIIRSWLGDSLQKFDISQFKLSTKESQYAHIIEDIRRNTQQLYTVISNISFVPKIDDDGKYLTCITSHATYSSPKSISFALDINFSPVVHIEINEKSEMRENGSAILHCNIKAKPTTNLQIIWFRNDVIIESAKTDVILLPNLNIDHHQSKYTCLVSNIIGESSDSIILNVTYGARIMSTEQHQAVNPGESAMFNCEAIGNPPPKIIWKKIGDGQVIAHGSSLTIESVQSWHRGEYECKATVSGFPSSRLINFLHIKGPPSVSVREEIIAANGETIEIICEVRGRPQPQDVIWLLNGSPIEYGRLGSRLQIHQVPRQFGVESKLIVQGVKNSDYGIYNCTAFNELGSDYQTIRLKSKSIIDALINIFPSNYLIPLIFLLFALILISMVYLFWRCKNHKCNPGSTYHEDPTIKVEPIDGGPYPFPSLNPPGITFSDNYISTMGTNPDFDYIGNSPNFDRLYPRVNNGTAPPANDCFAFDDSMNNHQSYGSFKSGASTPSNFYSYINSNKFLSSNSHLEPLKEVSTPEINCTNVSIKNTVAISDRPDSRLSTHV